MRWSRLLPICAGLCLTVALAGQPLPDFDLAIDPISLGSENIMNHLDTVRFHRKPVNLSFLKEEFNSPTSLTLEIFYQKSGKHRLLRLSKYHIVPDHIYAMTEGWGATHFRISDGNCVVISTVLRSEEINESPPLYRECIY